MFALDYDGVIADANALISTWIREHLGLDLPRYRCDLTQRLPVIGEERSAEMGRTVYGEDHTAKAEPVTGAQQALRSLSEQGAVYVVTARDETLTAFSRRWLDQAGLMPYIRDVVPMGSERKVDIAKRLGCKVLIDDDQRHLIPGVVPRLILMRVGMGRPAYEADGCCVCSTWEDATAAAIDAMSAV